jgi:hypothetical protein
VTAIVLVLGFALEHWPGTRAAPTFTETMAVEPGTLVFVTGAAVVREDEAVLGPGAVELLARAPQPLTSLHATVGGQGVLHARGLLPVVLRPTGALVDLPLGPYHQVSGRDGRTAAFTRATLAVEGQAVLRFGELPVAPPGPVGADPRPDGTSGEPGEGMEPEGVSLR